MADDGPRPDQPTTDLMAHPIFNGGRVGILTADAPRFPVQRPGGHQALLRDLRSMGLRHEVTEGSYGSPEQSVIVYGPSKEQMHALGHAYGQEAVVHCEGGKRSMLYTNGPNDGKANPGLSNYDFWKTQPPADYYTKLPNIGYVRLHFDDNKLDDAGPFIHQQGRVYDPEPVSKSDGVGGKHPNAYAWHDADTQHHFRTVPGGAGVLSAATSGPISLAKADLPGVHPHMDTPPVNDQAAGVGVSTYHKYAAPFGQIVGHHTNLQFYPLQGKAQQVKQLVPDHGFQSYYAGGRFGRPDLAKRNYNTKHLMIYDPSPDSGASGFGPDDRDYTDAWRHSHELGHALTLPELNSQYGEGRRIGKLGVHRTTREALRAVHWEWLAAHKQRELLATAGVHIPDDAFHRELNTVMHDAAHRAVTGKFTEPSGEGFWPHAHKVPLETSLGLVREGASNLGLVGPHDLLKTERSAPVNVADIRKQAGATLQKAVNERERQLRDMRTRELSKSRNDHDCLICNKGPGACECLARLQKGEPTGEPDRPCAHCNENPCKCPGSIPTPKEVKVEKTGSGGGTTLQRIRGKTMKKADVPMAKPPGGSSNAPPMSKPSAAPTKKPIAAMGKATAIEYGDGTGSASSPVSQSPPPAAPAVPAAPPVHTGGGMAGGAASGVGGPRGGTVAKSFAEVDAAADRLTKAYLDNQLAKNAADLEKSMAALEKAIPGRIGGRDPNSKMMTQHAMSAAAPPPGGAPAPAPAGPKLTPEDQARRAANMADFTPAGAYTAAGAGTAQAGALKPAAPAATGSHLARFTAALKGGKSAAPPAMKAEIAPVKKEEPSNSPAPLMMSEEVCAVCGKKGALCKCGSY